MVGFFIKKWFFDFWDNMLRIVLVNLGFVAALGIAIYVPYLLQFSTVLMVIGTAAVVVGFNLYVGAASRFMAEVADYNSPGFKDFIEYAKGIWKSVIVLSVIVGIQIFLIAFAVPFYLSLGGVMGLIALSIIFWASVIWWLAWQYYFPIRSRLDTNIKKVLKKSFLLLFDNTGFSIFMALFSLFVTAISVFTALLLPGLASVLLMHQVGFKLRLYKYDYLEEHPDADRSQIPWDALLVEEKDKVGHRSLKGMIFPWKE
jgi:uncharacterized membrane protein YesL